MLSPTAAIGGPGSYTFGSAGTTHPGPDRRGPAGGAYLRPADRHDHQRSLFGRLLGQLDNGPSASITIDLGLAYTPTWFDLFNTPDGFDGDRGTGNSTIAASNAIVADGAYGFTLSGSSTVAGGTLPARATSGAVSAHTFAVLAWSPTFRYLRVVPTSVASANLMINNI